MGALGIEGAGRLNFSDDAREVYRVMLADGSLGVDAIARQLGVDEGRVRSALDTLADDALLDHDDSRGPISVTPPRVALARLLAIEEADLARRAAEFNEMRSFMETLAAEFEISRDRESITHLTDVRVVRGRLEELSLAARDECVSLNPGRAHRPDAMAASKPLNERALERGIGIRCIYQDSFRNDHGTLAYARWLTGLGGQTRTLPVVPHQVVIVDSEVALLPRVVGDLLEGAVEVRTPSIVAALMAGFEAMWQVAEPFEQSRPPRVETGAPSALAREIVKLLTSGATDEYAARRLGVSARTVRRVVADLMVQLGAASRFQAGVEAARRGWADDD